MYFPENLVIEIDSRGGSIAPAFDWKTHLEQYSNYGKITIVVKQALSSGAIIFLSKNTHRIITEKSIVAFHKPIKHGKHTKEKIKLSKFFELKLNNLLISEGVTPYPPLSEPQFFIGKDIALQFGVTLVSSTNAQIASKSEIIL